MNTKLTLSIDADIIKKAKDFAQKHHSSLSGLVKNYFTSLIEQEDKKDTPSNIVKELTGVADYNKAKHVDDDRFDYLMERYS